MLDPSSLLTGPQLLVPNMDGARSSYSKTLAQLHQMPTLQITPKTHRHVYKAGATSKFGDFAEHLRLTDLKASGRSPQPLET